MGNKLIYVRGWEIKETQYFAQTAVDGTLDDYWLQPFAYWRRIWRDDFISEESWQVSKNIWVSANGRLLWMQISGECILHQVGEELFKQLVPKDYEDKEVCT